MREIKFRAWNETNERLVYPNGHIFTSADILNQYDDVMQYTGFKDSNGKEIYEGDILEFEDSYEYKGVYTVWIIEGGWSITQNCKYIDDLWNCVKNQYCEIIGNIHEVE